MSLHLALGCCGSAPLLPQQVTQRLEAADIKVIPTGIAHGTVTAIASGDHHEITTLRHDVETDGRRATVAFAGDWRDDFCFALVREFSSARPATAARARYMRTSFAYAFAAAHSARRDRETSPGETECTTSSAA